MKKMVFLLLITFQLVGCAINSVDSAISNLKYSKNEISGYDSWATQTVDSFNVGTGTYSLASFECVRQDSASGIKMTVSFEGRKRWKDVVIKNDNLSVQKISIGKSVGKYSYYYKSIRYTRETFSKMLSKKDIDVLIDIANSKRTLMRVENEELYSGESVLEKRGKLNIQAILTVCKFI